MIEYKSRDTIKCENCLVCDKITSIQDHDNFDKLLSKVELWDTQIKSLYKKIKTFECLVCVLKTINFNEWKCHIMSESHLAECHKTKDLYSHICDHKNCKVLIYGPEKSLSEHNTANNHSAKDIVPYISILMAEVMKCYISKQKTIYYCSHCKKSAYNPIHTKTELLDIKTKNTIEYYCKYCNVSFICNPEVLDYHSLSVEHLTLKCLDLLFSDAMTNKLSEKSIPTIENESLLTVQNAIINNTLKLPSILLNRFNNINQHHGKCNLCSVLVDWDCSNIFTHLHKCQYKFNLTGTNKTEFTTYSCYVCSNTFYNINEHKSHISSLEHLINCYDTTDLYSYFCKICNEYMYGHLNYIYDHYKLTHKNNLTNLPKLSIFMANTFKTINKYPNNNKIAKYYSINSVEPLEHSKYYYCRCDPCKIQFSSTIDFEMHEITSEHIILKFLTPKKLKKSKKKKKNSKFSVIQDKLSFSTLIMDNKHPQSVNKNKRANNVDVNCTAQLDSVKITQELPVNMVGQEEFDKNLQNNSIESNRDIKLDHKDHILQNHKKKAAINICDVISSTCNKSLIPTVSHESNEELHIKNSNALVYEATTNNDVYFNDLVFQNTNETIAEEIDKVPNSLTSLCPTNVSNLDEDKIYGEHIIQRLKHVKNATVKQYIKLEIDNIFYSNMEKIFNRK